MMYCWQCGDPHPQYELFVRVEVDRDIFKNVYYVVWRLVRPRPLLGDGFGPLRFCDKQCSDGFTVRSAFHGPLVGFCGHNGELYSEISHDFLEDGIVSGAHNDCEICNGRPLRFNPPEHAAAERLGKVSTWNGPLPPNVAAIRGT